ncbi:pyridoxal phosphate-dependent aminotransferase [Desulfoplanes formicivorans]|uniref:Aminotransferase n=1 Tax=Desulfoplanes formicivorans TaxID=1592317 RepID=A0A194AIQ6_9BACT|nr:pyridoxal phosphate-dependent aminotransferase [Desulfoplanes formicivorans]GAU09972.1 aspartate aminotransferase [Desulfoplanes formicivorans]
MRTLSKQVANYIEHSSWIRKMFEAGIVLKQQYGQDNVYDFSLGNPDLAPPKAVADGLRHIADQAASPFAFGYMPNAGYLDVRQTLAAHLAREQECPELGPDHIVLTCGAAGGLNALFKAVLEPGDEVICPAPYFVEYGFYVANHGGTLKPVACDSSTFGLDLEGIGAALCEKTRAVLINSPNNPTGQVYSREELDRLATLLKAHTRKVGRPVYLVSDEPYRFLVYDNEVVPPVLPRYTHSVVVGSFSKSLSLAGERVGYVAVNPAMEDVSTLVGGLILTNRILGFVNAPAIGQKLLGRALGQGVDLGVYDKRRSAMAKVLDDARISYVMPKGAFYFFPRVPGGSLDDTGFVNALMKENILAVPGSGFGFPGGFRLAFCVPEDVIVRSGEAFKRAVDAYLG